MKILFVTGDESCDCGGTGIVLVVLKRTKNQAIEVKINSLCKCVEAREAIVEDETIYDDDPKSLKIVPE
jgi:hypothetical protein